MRRKLKLISQHLFGQLLKKINGSHVSALLTKTDNGLFAVSPEDLGVGRALRVNGAYGLDEIARLRPFLTPASNVLVVGAHIGTLAIPISRGCKKVVAIEANPNTFALLEQNIALNKASNCHPIHIAASNQEETLPFLLSTANSGGSKRVPKHKNHIYYYDKPKEVSVKAVRLDDYLDDEFDVIIMDIEGSEYFALQGMQNILSTAKVLAVEFIPHHLKNVSGVTAEQFLSVIQPHFSQLTIPTKSRTLESRDFISSLSDMYRLEQEDDSLIFRKG